MVAKNGTPENQASETTAVETIDGFEEHQLRDLTQMSDVLAIAGGNVANISDVLGNGFAVLEDKTRLLDTEFVVVRYGEHKSDKGSGKFATMHVITRDGNKFVVNDGSTGIMAQLAEIKKEYGRVCPLYVPRGLRVSEYEIEDEKTGEMKRAKTFYLNTAK